MKNTSQLLDETRNLSPQNLQEIPQVVVFLQARTEFQVVWKLSEDFGQDWSKMEAKWEELSSYLFLERVGLPRERREMVFVVVRIFLWKIEEFVAKSYVKVNYE